MPEPHEAMSPVREAEYLLNAAEAAREATDPVVAELGTIATEETIVAAAEGLTRKHGEGAGVGGEAERFLWLSHLTSDAYTAIHQDRRKDLKYQRFGHGDQPKE